MKKKKKNINNENILGNYSLAHTSKDLNSLNRLSNFGLENGMKEMK